MRIAVIDKFRQAQRQRVAQRLDLKARRFLADRIAQLIQETHYCERCRAQAMVAGAEKIADLYEAQGALAQGTIAHIEAELARCGDGTDGAGA